MTTKLLVPLTAFFLIFNSFLAHLCFADEEAFQLTELTVMNSKEDLLLFGALQNSVRAEVAESLQNGIALDFTFYAELHKTTPNWPKELITTISFKHTISYDTLRDGYTVILQEENNQAVRFSSLFEAQEKVERINGVVIAPMSQLIPEQTYQVRVRAELAQKTLELGVNKILPLIKKKDIKTKWQTIEFSY